MGFILNIRNNKMKIKSLKVVQLPLRPDQVADVDIDFPSNRRDDVKNYIKERFGKFHTCSIGTFGRLKLKGAIKDFCRVNGLSFDKVNAITKSIDDETEYTFDDFVGYATKSKELYNFFQEHPDVIHLTKYCLGQAKTASIHASAVVIVPEEDKHGNPIDIFGWMPIRKVGGVLISEWEGKYIDKAGFLKEDILGLSQLDKFKFTLDLIKKTHKKKIDLNNIDFEQKEVFSLFKAGNTEDVFQFGTVGLKKYSVQAKPDTIEDLTAMTSLYRPGPMDSNAHVDFADIKAGKKKPHYDFGLKEVTQNTFGLLVYQEQIMKSVVVLGGFTLVESDLMRTVMKKKDVATLNSYKEKFMTGAKERGCELPEAEKIWLKLLAFSAYGFNRCLSYDTLILTKEIGYITIERMYVNYKNGKLYTLFSLEESIIFEQKLKNVYDNGLQKVYEVKLENGNKIKVTENHKLLTTDGYKTLKELKIGDIIICYG